MDETRATLAGRVLAVLRAKQHLVFFAIALTALDLGVPALAAWLHHGGTSAESLLDASTPLEHVLRSRDPLIAFLVAASLLTGVWFRAGYIRSILGSLHLRPQDGRQYGRLLVFTLVLDVVVATAAAFVGASPDPARLLVAQVAFLAFVVVVQYGDYAIVITGVGPLRALARSWSTVRAEPIASVAIALAWLIATTGVALLLLPATADGLLHGLPLLLVTTVLLGCLTFAADVALIVVYLTAVERGAVPPHSGRRVDS